MISTQEVKGTQGIRLVDTLLGIDTGGALKGEWRPSHGVMVLLLQAGIHPGDQVWFSHRLKKAQNGHECDFAY